jgi:hypothetical protein
MSCSNASLGCTTRADEELSQSEYRRFNIRLHKSDKAARYTAEYCTTAECMSIAYGYSKGTIVT